MVWLRYRVIVPRDASPLAVHLTNEDASGIPLEVLVNGVRVSDPRVLFSRPDPKNNPNLQLRVAPPPDALEAIEYGD